jgi:hypothetical protein
MRGPAYASVLGARGRVYVAHRARQQGRVVTVTRTRSFLYSLARFLGDYQAVKNGRMGKRLARRAAGRVAGRGLGRLFP